MHQIETPAVVLDRAPGESMAAPYRKFQISREPAGRSASAMRNADWMGSTVRADRSGRLSRQAREIALNRLQDPGAPPQSTVSEVKVPTPQHHPRHPRPAWAGDAPGARTRTESTPLSEGATPNSLCCAGYKGEFKLGNQRYCYFLPSPITPRGAYSSYGVQSGAVRFHV